MYVYKYTYMYIIHSNGIIHYKPTSTKHFGDPPFVVNPLG